MNGNLDIYIIHGLFYSPVILLFIISIYFLSRSKDYKKYVHYFILLYVMIFVSYFIIKFPRFNEKLIESKNYQNEINSIEKEIFELQNKNKRLTEENDNLKNEIELRISELINKKNILINNAKTKTEASPTSTLR